MAKSYQTKEIHVDSDQFYQFMNYWVNTGVYSDRRDARKDNYEQGFKKILNENGVNND